MIALGLLCLAVMVIAVPWRPPSAPWLLDVIAAVLALAAALVAFGVIKV